MVAYSFKQQFVSQIEAGVKRSTLRGPRKRHARQGEPVQLYYAMRTKHCRKIITPDPICSATQIAELRIDRDAEELITFLSLDARPQNDFYIERFAVGDGFGGRDVSARRAMGEFWLKEHLAPEEKTLRFIGMVIRWRPANG